MQHSEGGDAPACQMSGCLQISVMKLERQDTVLYFLIVNFLSFAVW